MGIIYGFTIVLLAFLIADKIYRVFHPPVPDASSYEEPKVDEISIKQIMGGRGYLLAYWVPKKVGKDKSVVITIKPDGGMITNYPYVRCVDMVPSENADRVNDWIQQAFHEMEHGKDVGGEEPVDAEG